MTRRKKIMKNTKLAIVGVGHVGSYVLSDAMKTEFFSEIVVIDKDKDVAFGEAHEQAHATALNYMANTKVYAGDYTDVKDADVIIIAAGPSVIITDKNAKPDRALLAEENATIIREVM